MRPREAAPAARPDKTIVDYAAKMIVRFWGERDLSPIGELRHEFGLTLGEAAQAVAEAERRARR